jgi:hypothetical protein
VNLSPQYSSVSIILDTRDGVRYSVSGVFVSVRRNHAYAPLV